MIRINNLKIYEELSDEELLEYALRKNKLNKKDVKTWYIFKKSIDARDKNNVHYVYTLDLELNGNKEKYFQKVEKYVFPIIEVKRKSESRPVIVGFGPAGMFAGLVLAEYGLKPIILEQGNNVEQRIKDVEDFRENRKLNPFSNIQFGEGGAGTFSDGKLNTGNTSTFSRKVLEEFIRFGAPKEILYTAKPHIGTDNLVNVVRNIREYIKSKGGDVIFNEKVTDFKIENGRIVSVIASKEFRTDTVILAIGHSSRETIKRLLELGVDIKPKDFAVGVRIEHLQKLINESQYGTKTKLKLPSADYKLVYHAQNGRVAYSFCMCPGGEVVASSSEPNTIVTNGMSRFARDGRNANSALLVNVKTSDFESDDPLAGIKFQEKLEKNAFILGGENYNAPCQRVQDFLENRKTEKFGEVIPSYKPDVTKADLNEILPKFVTETLKEAIIELDKRLKGFGNSDAVLTGVETRTSSAVTIVRYKETLNSNIKGIYPVGEGAGYAGGIMTSAIDGIKCALKIINTI